jgi:cysteine desulfurase
MTCYLDCAATTPIDPRVLDEVVRFMRNEYGNAGSRTHSFGERARRAVERARDQVAAVVAASRAEVVFTSGATEANNLAILGLADHGAKIGHKHIVSTAIEHNAVLEPLSEMERRAFEVTLIRPTPGGWVDPAAVRAAVRDDTLLVSVMHVNNETGVIQPIDQIAALLAEHRAHLHVDAAQGFGKELAALRNPRLDLISISGHKFHAPKGVGALIARRRNGQRPPLAPLMFGGGQERGLRPGTLPVQLIVGLGLASELVLAEADQRNTANRQFRHRALEALQPLDPVFNGDQARTVPHILNLSFPGVDAEEAMEALAPVAAVSNGSACTSQSLTCSHVLSAMGQSARQIEGALRLSWSHMTPDPDWARFVDIIRHLRSPQ